MLKLCQLDACPSGTLGLHLSRAPWDPYPWVSGVQDGSSAQRAGVQNGDTVLELNGRDVLGQKIAQIAEHIAEHWKSGATHVTVVVWRNQAAAVTANSDDDEEQRLGNEAPSKQQRQQQQQRQSINQLSLQKFATCLQHIAQLLECPVCREVIRPPGWQCCNGHVVCNDCRSRSVKCPVCRVPLGPRGRCLLADKLFTLLAESFPCDGVKNNNKNNKKNKNSSCNANNENSNNASPADTTKCSRVFQNRPKMAAALFKDKTLVKPKTQESRNQIKCGDETPSRREAARQIDGSPSAGEGLEAGVVAPCASNVTREHTRTTAASRGVHSLNEKEVLKSLPAGTTTGEREETSLSSTNVNAIITSTPASSNKSNSSNDNKSQPSPTSPNFGSSSRLTEESIPGNGKAELVDVPGACSWQRVSPVTAAGMRATTATTITMTMS